MTTKPTPDSGQPAAQTTRIVTHSPGPWKQNLGPNYGTEQNKRANQLYVRLGSGGANAIVERKNTFGPVSDEDLANARLIAAAPALVSALETWERFVEDELSRYDEPCNAEDEQDLCPKCKETGCIWLKIKATRDALAAAKGAK